MAESINKEYLQPSLLDRLTDAAPDQKTETLSQRVLSQAKLRDCVRRDLSWLFNAQNLANVQDLTEHPEVARSSVNFGVPDLSGRAASGLDIPSLERLFRQAIIDFEPRLARQSVNVRVLRDTTQMSNNAVSFVIEADLWGQPMPLKLFLRTQLNLEDGEVSVTELNARDGA